MHLPLLRLPCSGPRAEAARVTAAAAAAAAAAATVTVASVATRLFALDRALRYSDLDPGEGLPPGHAERVGGMSKAAREAAAQESVRPEGLRHLQLRPYNNDSG